jgi:hypothetical protein
MRGRTKSFAKEWLFIMPEGRSNMDILKVLEHRISDIEAEIERHTPITNNTYISGEGDSYIVLNNLLEKYIDLYARIAGYVQ